MCVWHGRRPRLAPLPHPIFLSGGRGQTRQIGAISLSFASVEQLSITQHVGIPCVWGHKAPLTHRASTPESMEKYGTRHTQAENRSCC